MAFETDGQSMSDASDKPAEKGADGRSPYLPVLGLELAAAKPKLGGGHATGKAGAAPKVVVERPVTVEPVITGEIRGGEPGSVLEDLLAYCEKNDGSDVHLTPGHPPLVRIDGELVRVAGYERLRAEETEAMSEEIMNSGQRRALEERGAADGACSSPGGARFRFNVFRRQGKRAIVLRRLEDRFRTMSELGLPDELYKLADLSEGLVVFSGPTGCGKSTTLATLLDKINRERRCHLITIEDPVEYIHDPKMAEVNQRELFTDVPDFNEALIAALREDPDVILVGEVRDQKTIRMAITAAETGHLVFTTVHAGDCTGTIERLVGVFPADEQEGIRRQLALVLRAVVNQQLLPAVSKDGRKGRVAAAEVLVNTTAVSNLIVLGKSNLLYSCMETGRSAGMQTMDQDIARLWASGLIDEQTATATCRNVTVMRERAKFLLKERGEGQRLFVRE
jgi:twitching motility protein PilT